MALCESAKKGHLCCDDLCRGSPNETLCGFDLDEYERMDRDYSDDTDYDDFREVEL